MRLVQQLTGESAAASKTFRLNRTDVLKMLMTMDRYQVDSVVLRQEEDYLNWELPQAKRPKRSVRAN
jgi:hypothetical protein